MSTLRYRFGVLRHNLFRRICCPIARMSAKLLSANAVGQFDGKRIMIVSPHPDDEVFGCGGLISHCVAAGNYPHVVILSGGGGSLGADRFDKERVVAERGRLTDRAMAALGLPLTHLTRLFLSDGHLTEELSDPHRLSSVVRSLKDLGPLPDIILVPSLFDDSPDHKAAHRFGLHLQEECRVGGHAPELWNYCVWEWYCHPVRLALKARDHICLTMSGSEHEAKSRAIDIYTQPDAASGVCWSGRLPRLFVDAHRWNGEIYYRNK